MVAQRAVWLAWKLVDAWVAWWDSLLAVSMVAWTVEEMAERLGLLSGWEST